MKTIKTTEKPDYSIQVSELQMNMITKILGSAQNSFDEADDEDRMLLGEGYDYLSNQNFVCSLTTEEYEALQSFIK